MIKNERQYRITKAQADKFESALAQATERASQRDDIDPLVQLAISDGLRSQLEELKEELAEYESLRSGRRQVVAASTIDELPRALIKARIAARLTQKELGRRVGLKEQQIQRYEATEYAGASLDRVREIMDALQVRCRIQVRTGDATASGGRTTAPGRRTH